MSPLWHVFETVSLWMLAIFEAQGSGADGWRMDGGWWFGISDKRSRGGRAQRLILTHLPPISRPSLVRPLWWLVRSGYSAVHSCSLLMNLSRRQSMSSVLQIRRSLDLRTYVGPLYILSPVVIVFFSSGIPGVLVYAISWSCSYFFCPVMPILCFKHSISAHPFATLSYRL